MTEGTPQNAPRRGGLDWPVFVVGGAILLALLWFLAGDSGRALQRGATGFSGLVSWLKEEGFDARSFKGGGSLVRGEVGLRILPLFDTDLEKDRERPTTLLEVLAETSQQDIRLDIVNRKIRDQSTLIVLPKWRAAMPIFGVAHRNHLIPEAEIARVAGQLGLRQVQVRRNMSGFESRTLGEGGRVGLMHGQTLGGTGCVPMLGTRDAMLLGQCPIDSDATGAEPTHFWLLSDPDLLNNHGLALADNASVVSVLAQRVPADRPIMLDLTRLDHTAAENWVREPYKRSWEDFARMFAWPFTMIWVAFICLGALVLWRAITRFGPVARATEDQPRASKEISIDAKARLLRLAGQDAPLLAEHVQARIAQLAAELLGPHRRADQTPLEMLYRLIQRRDPGLADELAEAAHIPEGLGPDDIIHRLDLFETCYDKVIHGFGRTPGAG